MLTRWALLKSMNHPHKLQPERGFLSPFLLHLRRISSLSWKVLIMAMDRMSHCFIRAHRTAGALYLVWLSGPPQVFHCLPQIQSQALGLVSSPLSGALVAQTCPHPDEPPPRSCSGRRGCGKNKKEIFLLLSSPLLLLIHCKALFLSASVVKPL